METFSKLRLQLWWNSETTLLLLHLLDAFEGDKTKFDSFEVFNKTKDVIDKEFTGWKKIIFFTMHRHYKRLFREWEKQLNAKNS